MTGADLPSKPWRRPIQVLVHPIRFGPRGHEYLVLRRIERLGGFWQVVSGAPEWGESLDDAARRELVEETGLHANPLLEVGYSYGFPVEPQWAHAYEASVTEIVEHVFAAVVVGTPKLSWEHSEYRWCSLSGALELVSWEPNREALRRCEALVAEGVIRVIDPGACHESS